MKDQRLTTIDDFLNNGSNWDDQEVISDDARTFILCSDEDGFWLEGSDGKIYRTQEDLRRAGVSLLTVSLVWRIN